MKKKECKGMLDMEDKCPKCRNGVMEIACESFVGGKYYYIYCNKCRFTFEG